MLSCNSIKASICGLALSWKYSPHALGASHKNSFETVNKLLIVAIIEDRIALLCNGKLVNAWGLGGLCNAHSNPGAHLSLSILK